ncbi:MAG: hypothetical protein LBR28_03155, partial [Bacteroidales bacterium]|nr:hypothetical protein [Bacteroidales bacterium]
MKKLSFIFATIICSLTATGQYHLTATHRDYYIIPECVKSLDTLGLLLHNRDNSAIIDPIKYAAQQYYIDSIISIRGIAGFISYSDFTAYNCPPGENTLYLY